MIFRIILRLALLAGLLAQPLALLGETLKCGPPGLHDHLLAAGAGPAELAAHLQAEADCRASALGASTQPASTVKPGHLVLSAIQADGRDTGVAAGVFLVAHLAAAPALDLPAELWLPGAVRHWQARSLEPAPASPPPWSPYLTA